MTRIRTRPRGRFFYQTPLLCILLLLCGCEQVPVLGRGQAAPDFTLRNLEGAEVTLSRFKGRNVCLFFWNRGCPLCETDRMDQLNRVYLRGRRAGLDVISINIAEAAGDVGAFARKRRLIFPILLDPEARVTRKRYGVYVVPTLYLIGKDGMIMDKAYGYLTEEALEDFVRPSMEGQGG
jgi:peroxiredoxin